MTSLPKQLVKPTQVLLHVYDLGKSCSMQVVNSVSRVFDWGIFHVGVEVYGKEWCFERVFEASVPGIFAYTPKQHPSHSYRESVLLGETQLTHKQLVSFIMPAWQRMAGDFVPSSSSQLPHIC